jgi:tRNA pseudouridine synthase 10
VQECIQDLAAPLFGASDAKFASAGREDVDVRMLGEGRPFVMELIAPKKAYQTKEALAELAAQISACDIVEVRNLRMVESKAMGTLMKSGGDDSEEQHRKDYRCVVILGRSATQADVDKLNGLKDVVLAQTTPLRVLHRRTLMVRERTVYSMRATKITSRFLVLDLNTQSGTYVKEFVHSDFGRTEPSIGSLLGCEADIMQLDVMGLQEAPGSSAGGRSAQLRPD